MLKPIAILSAYAALTCSFLSIAEEQNQIEEIEVSIHPLSAEGLAQAVAVLKGEALSRSLAGSIGATVSSIPGIRSQSFGEASGRPVIHGLAGPRVKVMEDRIDTLDASVTSTDHATTIEPFIADQIEVLKGAATLLYGSGAIGGVVDVHTGRIPHAVPDSTSARAEVRYADNGDKLVGSLRADGGRESIAWHIDAFGRDANAYDIPGFVESSAQRAAEMGGGTEEEARDRLPGSQLRNQGGAVGLSWVGDKRFFGISVSQYEANYGLPGGHGDEGNPTVDLEQTRVDLEAGIEQPFSGFESINLRVGNNNYRHSEIEPDGAVGTRFDNEAWEARLELVHAPVGDWQGAFGVQIGDRDFSAVGEEAFLNPVDSSNAGLFWVGNRAFDGFDLQAGARYERVEHKPTGAFNGLCGMQTLKDERFSSGSASIGVVAPVGQQHSLKLAIDYANRAPAIEELYSCGLHLASQTFEIGEPSLDEEEAVNISLTWQYVGERWDIEANAYHIEFSDYIFQRAVPDGMGEQQVDPDEGLPVFQYDQSDATFTGLDLKAVYKALEWNKGGLTLEALFDTVRAKLDSSAGGDTDIPRIPASRYGVGIALVQGDFSASVDYQRVSKQDDIAQFELETEAYNDLGIYAALALKSQGSGRAKVFVQGRNLTDDEQRNHTSFIKDFTPAPGRRIELGLQLEI